MASEQIVHSRCQTCVQKQMKNKWFKDYDAKRPPDFIVGGKEFPYMRRWWIIPRNRVFNIYLHHFLRSDDDRALHDHPSWNISFILEGAYTEWGISAGGVHHSTVRQAGMWKF